MGRMIEGSVIVGMVKGRIGNLTNANSPFHRAVLRGEGQTFFRAFINSELGPPEVALTQNL